MHAPYQIHHLISIANKEVAVRFVWIFGALWKVAQSSAPNHLSLWKKRVGRELLDGAKLKNSAPKITAAAS
jgi:hypothetical protein